MFKEKVGNVFHKNVNVSDVGKIQVLVWHKHRAKFYRFWKILNQGKIILDEPYNWNWGNNFPKLVACVKAPYNIVHP